jgi:hypothetical protein
MEFSELSLKKCKIYLSAVKMTYDSRHTVWVETYLIQRDIKLAENGRVDRNERARMEVHSAIFSQMGFSAKCAIRPNGLFGQTGFRPNEFRPIEVGSLLFKKDPETFFVINFFTKKYRNSEPHWQHFWFNTYCKFFQAFWQLC